MLCCEVPWAEEAMFIEAYSVHFQPSLQVIAQMNKLPLAGLSDGSVVRPPSPWGVFYH